MRWHLVPTLVALALGCSAQGPSGAPTTRTQPPLPAVVPAVASAKTPPPDPREQVLATTVVHLLEEDHLLHKRIDDTVSREAFATYLERLDGEKMYLLASDKDELARYADKIDDELHAGSLDLAHLGEKMFVARVDVVEKVVASLLAAPIQVQADETIETDPKKIDWARSEDELRDRWRKRLELEVLERVSQMETRLEKREKDKAAALKDKAEADKAKGKADKAKTPPVDEDDDKADRDDMKLADIPATPEAREAKAREDLAKLYAGRFARLRHPDPLDAAADLINAVTLTLDPHTDYLPPADKANFDLQMTGSLEGIGASLREHDHYIEVVELVPGGAAWRQGQLAAGDLILAVQNTGKDPVDVVDMRIDDVVAMIRGPKGTVVKLRVQKQDGHQETLAITRDVVVIEETYARGAVLTRKGKSYGYIHLPGFYGSSGGRTASEDVHRLLRELARRKVAGIVLDIRSNGGGLLQDAVKLTGEMIDQGPVVQVRDGAGHREVLSDDEAGEDYDGPLVVMVDRFSASASEILAGALQDYHRAVIVGTTTHGKGTVQTLADVDHVAGTKDDLGVLKLTIEQFFRPDGASTQLEGVTPDVSLPDPAGYLDLGERHLDHPIAWSKIDPVMHSSWKVTWRLPYLVERSAARVAKSPVLSKIASTNAIMRKERDDTVLPLGHDAWEARRKKIEAIADATTVDASKLAPAFTVETLDDPEAVAPGPGGKTDDRVARWRDAVSKDAWLGEAVSILADMSAR